MAAPSNELPSEPIVDVSRARGALTIARKAGNLLGPEVTIDHVPRNYAIAIRHIRLDEADFYTVDGKKAIGLSGLRKLAIVAGISFTDSSPRETPHPLVWGYKVTGKMRLIDGRDVVQTLGHTLDLRDGSPLAKGMKDGQLQKYRAFGPQHCESRAQARVIRSLLGIRSYTPTEAAQPFFFAALVWMPVESKELDMMIAARELGIAAEVYGAAPAPAPTLALPMNEGVDELAELTLAADKERAPVEQRREEAGPAHTPFDDAPGNYDPDPVCERCGEALKAESVQWLRTQGHPLLCRDHWRAWKAEQGGSK
jgi:hypothetical protein